MNNIDTTLIKSYNKTYTPFIIFNSENLKIVDFNESFEKEILEHISLSSLKNFITKRNGKHPLKFKIVIKNTEYEVNVSNEKINNIDYTYLNFYYLGSINSLSDSNSIINTINTFILRFDRNYKLTFINSALVEFLNLKKENILNNSIFDILHTDFHSQIEFLLKNISFEKPRVKLSFQTLKYKKGTWVEFEIKGLFDNEKKLTGYQAEGYEITERKIFLDNVEKQKQYLENLIDTQTTLVFRLDGKNKFRFVNSSFSKLVGINKLLLKNKSITQFIHDDSLEKFKSLIKQVKTSPFNSKGIICLNTKNGIRHIELELHAIKDSNKTISEIQGAAIDITEKIENEKIIKNYYSQLEILINERTVELKELNKKLFEEIKERSEFQRKLSESEARYRHLFENLNEGVLVVSIKSGKITFFNKSLLEILDLSEDEIKDRPLLELFPSYSNEYLNSVYKSIISEKTKILTMFPYLKSGNLIRYADIRFSKIFYNNEDSLLISFSDMTEKFKIEKNLSRINIAFKYSTDAIILTDNVGHITDMNDRAMELFKIKQKDQYLDKKASILFESKNKKELGNLIAKSLTSNKQTFFEWEIGDHTPIELSISSMNDNNNNLGFVIIGRDISQRKKYENQLKDNLREKELLIKEIHHRVKNNLQVINSILSLQSRYLDDPRLLDIVEESQNRIKSMSIIHESLCNSDDISHIDLNDYLSKLSLYMQHSYPDSNAEIIKGSCDENILLDLQTATSCGIIINELVSNSLKHAFKNFEEKAVVKIDFNSLDGYYQFSVSDNGIGIDESINFEKAKSFGLRLIKILTKQLKGSVEMHSGHGTKFIVRFPK